MWARYCEMLLGLWLIASHWIFTGAGWLQPVCGAVVIVLAIVSVVRARSRAHLVELVPALVLIVVGWLGTRGEHHPPADQNAIVLGLLVAMFAIVPSRAFDPPETWIEEEPS